MTAPWSMDEMGGLGGIIGKCAGKCQHFANPALALNPPISFRAYEIAVPPEGRAPAGLAGPLASPGGLWPA
ncbi:hypothetical protein DTW68_03520 [Vibrio harveyi]|nr:hypothetical protein DTW68_02795 [Vibrio harveyi]RCR64800.1 hypothetical protein DTW68_03160 [Vibrio harveyi]RCR64858.1 hypothetical protein DTW68_03480 [Vibrio harveyi]RCR64863.1 hypothetical protein DTW68_03520 [Vibrio harveyi]